jgi:hypothetical protein
MMNFFDRNGTHLGLFSIGAAVLLLVAVLLVRRRIAFLKIKESPPTPAEAFRKYKPPIQPTEAARPRLTHRGRWAVILAAVWGSIWVGVTFATLHAFAMDYRFAKEAQTITAAVSRAPTSPQDSGVRYEFLINGQAYRGYAADRMRQSLRHVHNSIEMDVSYIPSDPTINRPAGQRPLFILQGLLPCACLALLAFNPAGQLRRDLVLARIGRVTTGIVVGVLSGRSSYSISLYYDFADDQGGVTRGDASLRGEYWQAAAGSPIEVLYLPGNPARNNLKLSMYWQ